MTLLKMLCRTLLGLACAGTSWLAAEPVHVRQAEGRAHGFFVVRLESGAIIGHGDLIQTVEGDRVTLKSLYTFQDGSVDEETTVYTQRGEFRLVSDHHVQRGPFFTEATDALVEANGQVTIRTVDKDGKEKVEANHMHLPNDLANGIVSVILYNLPPGAQEFKLNVLAGVGKGRLVKVDVASAGKDTFTLGGARRTANIFRVKTEIGGVAGMIAPLVGKQPEDAFVWVMEGPAPVAIRGVRQLSLGGPMVSVEVTGGTFPKFTSAK